MSRIGTPARPRSVIVQPKTGTGGMSYGQRPWPGIAGEIRADCTCCWAYRGRWPFGRMEVKYANSSCPVYAHSRPYSADELWSGQ